MEQLPEEVYFLGAPAQNTALLHGRGGETLSHPVSIQLPDGEWALLLFSGKALAEDFIAANPSLDFEPIGVTLSRLPIFMQTTATLEQIGFVIIDLPVHELGTEKVFFRAITAEAAVNIFEEVARRLADGQI